MQNTLLCVRAVQIKKTMKKEEIVKKHIAKYYHHKGRSVNNDDILPISRILPMMDEYATNKMIDENKSMLAMAELHMDERACVVLKQRIFELEKSLG